MKLMTVINAKHNNYRGGAWAGFDGDGKEATLATTKKARPPTCTTPFVLHSLYLRHERSLLQPTTTIPPFSAVFHRESGKRVSILSSLLFVIAILSPQTSDSKRGLEAFHHKFQSQTVLAVA